MPLPSWPEDVPFSPQADSVKDIDPMLAPIKTEMEGGNVRLRGRPGDNVGIVPQVIRMTNAQYNTFTAWGKGDVSNWTARFTADVWLGSSFGNKVCQFHEGRAPKPGYVDDDIIDVAMTLRVYDY
ncbi:hypothetical protein V1291_000051 [Nitrobacteraceae bacterium AZCC 1564]